MPPTILKYFAFAHLPPKLQTVSKPIGELAQQMYSLLSDGPEKAAGMRKLLEAKDCFVRSALDMPDPEASKVTSYQQSVLDEKRELDICLQKLMEFNSSLMFDSLQESDQLFFERKVAAMRACSEILGEQIATF